MKVLAAVDGSKYARWTLEWIGRMPWTVPPEVTALHVLDVASVRSPVMVQPLVLGNELFIQAEIKRMQARAKQVKTEATNLLASLKLKGKMLIEKGPVAPSILRRAPIRNGLVAVGSRGLDALDRFLLGSASTRVTQHASCSVLVVKEPMRPIRRLLLATDGSKFSGKALQFLIREIKPQTPAGALEVIVVHVMPFLQHPESKDGGKALVHLCADKLEQAGFRASEVSQVGHPADEIIKIADRQKVDLIVAGAKGLGAVARFFLGSVSTRLVQHSTCSVLVVR